MIAQTLVQGVVGTLAVALFLVLALRPTLLRPRRVIAGTDRYGGVYPDPTTVCHGPCEGLGVYPIDPEDPSLTNAEAAAAAEAYNAMVSRGDAYTGYVFIRCPDCGGSGERASDDVSPGCES